MRKCRQCGFPRVFGRYLDWNSDGTISGGRGTTLPVLFLGVDERETIFRELSESIGFPIEHIVIEAQRNVGRELYEATKSRFGNINFKRIPNNRFFRPQWLVRAMGRVLAGQFAGLGVGRLSVVGYRAGEYLVLRFSNPCLIPAVVGNLMGIYESLEEMPAARAEYRLEDGGLILKLSHAEEATEAEERLYLEAVEPGEGGLSYDRCPKCGVPLAMAETLEWDLARGVIRNMKSGEREGLIAVQSFFAILRELETELGREAVDILYDSQRGYTLSHIRDAYPNDPGGFWEGYLTELALRGQGYPERCDVDEDSISLEIRNAYDQDLYAAKAAAGLEYLTGGGSRIEWRLRERHLGKYDITAT